MSSVIIFSATEAAVFCHCPHYPPTNLLSLTTCSLGEGSADYTAQVAQGARIYRQVFSASSSHNSALFMLQKAADVLGEDVPGYLRQQLFQ